MVILGIDYGLKHIGLALASGPLADPLANLQVTPNIYEQIRQICQKQNVERIVVGISEGKMEENTRLFAKKLEQITQIPVDFQDETLSSHQVIEKLVEAKSKRSKRKSSEHMFAATLILQEFLDQDKTEKVIER